MAEVQSLLEVEGEPQAVYSCGMGAGTSDHVPGAVFSVKSSRVILDVMLIEICDNMESDVYTDSLNEILNT